ILYFRSLNRKIIIHSVDGEIDFYGNMEELLQKINEEYFWRIHKSYIINYMQVKKIEYTDAVMNNGEILPISQRYRVDIRNRQRSMLVQERKDD
ncbi:MAG: LytTR family transcriptional regulator, partial [Clostridiales bacterium]|nr:LytTR family transcriptional regulator [Clostridiales bacterium]